MLKFSYYNDIEKRRDKMGFDFKEKLQNVNKKNVAIVTLVLLVIAICSIGGFEYYQYTQTKTNAQATENSYSEEMPIDLSGQPKKPSEYNIGIEYNKAMKGKKPVLALFYADWCGYCVRFMPVFQAVANKYQDDMVFTKVNVEDKEYEKVVNEIGITGFPTVYILDPKYDNKILISNAVLRNIDTLSPELDRFIRIRKLLDSKKK